MDTVDTLPIEWQRRIERHDKQNDRAEKLNGWGATTEGKAITQEYHARLAEGVREAFKKNWGRYDIAPLVARCRALSEDTIALCILQSALHSIGLSEGMRATLLRLGTNLAGECWAAGLLHEEPIVARRIQKAIKKRHSDPDKRMVSARVAAKRAGYNDRMWSPQARLKAGEWLYNILMEALPDVFVRVDGEGPEDMLSLTDSACEVADRIYHETIVRNPVLWPSAEVPQEWTGWREGGSRDPRVNRYITMLRSHQKATQAAVKQAVKTGQIKPAMDALNALQSVAYKVNTRILDVVLMCKQRGLQISGLPEWKDIAKPMLPKPWDDMSAPERRLWKMRVDETKKANLGFIGDRALFAEDMTIAEEMAKLERFYTPMNCDWRGRVYPITHFNFQREDHIRALFLFADGAPIGEEGLWWLKVHVANCGAFQKVDKRPLQERVDWVDANIDMIRRVAQEPLVDAAFIGPTQEGSWVFADKPFLFLAGCTELVEAIDAGPDYVTHMPVSFDGTCSGLQHLCAMTRAEEGRLVNLVPADLPQDVYNTVAEGVLLKVAAELEDPEKKLAVLLMAYGINRSLVKRNVMTYSYSSKKFGMASQQQTDTMDVLSREVLEGKLEEHPFEGYQYGDAERPGSAARYIANHVFDAIEEQIEKPAEAMHFLQNIAKTMAHEGKPVRWVTPIGLPWLNYYPEPNVTRVGLFLRDGAGVKVRTEVSIADGYKKDVDKGKASNGIAPNFVHALDASHLLLVVLAARAEGINQIATVHDSFGCLAPHAKRFNQIIREEFFRMYDEHDVLTEILEQASCDLTDANRHRLPARPTNGPLELKGILNADFAFS